MHPATTLSPVNVSLQPQEIMMEFLQTTYSWLIPVMIIILLVAIVGNSVIVFSSPWLSSPVSPYLKLCISLAAADMWAAALLITGLVVNSYMPVVLGYEKTSLCLDAWLEVFRISGMLTSDLHLFALAINQFVGTKWPLRYKIMVTTRRIRGIIMLLWLIPLFFVLSWFMANESDGLRHETCRFVFYNQFPFRVTIFLIFMVPLLATLLIYAMILGTLLKAKAEFESTASKRFSSSSRRSTVHSKLKLVWTTLLIVSSFALSWGLCVLYFVLVCKDGCMFTYLIDVDFYLGLVLSSSAQLLVMLKLASNPFIYTLRIKAIRNSVDHLCSFLCIRKTYPTLKTNQNTVALMTSSSVGQNSL